eukprot:gene26005-34606_t
MLVSLEGLSSTSANSYEAASPQSPPNAALSSHKPLLLKFDCSEMESIESVVLRFCETYNINRRSCANLYKEVITSLRSEEPSCPQLQYDSYFHPFLKKNIESFDNERFNDFLVLESQHLGSTFAGVSEQQQELDLEAAVDDDIFDQFLMRYTNDRDAADVASLPRKALRVCFIHSCLLENRSTDILEELLRLIHATSLGDELSNIWVLNYGDDLTQRESFQDQILVQFPTVTFIQRSSDPSRFEVPTLRHLHTFASGVSAIQNDGDPEQDVQILYLHTKGVTYQDRHPVVTDWTNMMLYFMVEEHRRCFHLLASGEFDTVGTNCDPDRPTCYSGNMWWATASYIRRLTPLQWDQAGKVAAEFWLHYLPGEVPPRFKNLHRSHEIVN